MDSKQRCTALSIFLLGLCLTFSATAGAHGDSGPVVSGFIAPQGALSHVYLIYDVHTPDRYASERVPSIIRLGRIDPVRGGRPTSFEFTASDGDCLATPCVYTLLGLDEAGTVNMALSLAAADEAIRSEHRFEDVFRVEEREIAAALQAGNSKALAAFFLDNVGRVAGAGVSPFLPNVGRLEPGAEPTPYRLCPPFSVGGNPTPLPDCPGAGALTGFATSPLAGDSNLDIAQQDVIFH